METLSRYLEDAVQPKVNQYSYIYGTKVRIRKPYKPLLRQIAAKLGINTEDAFREAISRRLNDLNIPHPDSLDEAVEKICDRTGRSKIAEVQLCIDRLAESLNLKPIRPLAENKEGWL